MIFATNNFVSEGTFKALKINNETDMRQESWVQVDPAGVL